MFNFVALILFLFFSVGCEHVYQGSGYVVHNDRESMDFAWGWYDKNNYDRAIEMSETALKINPESIDALTLIALIQIKRNQLDTSIATLEKAKEISERKNLPDRDYIYCKLGIAYFKKNEFSNALSVFEEAKKSRKDAYGVESQIAMTYWMLGDKDRAIEAMKSCKVKGGTKKEFFEFLTDFSFDSKPFDELITAVF